MRITPNITINNSLHNIQTSRALLDSIQEKIASGKNYNRISDDPVMARLLVGINDRFGANEQYRSNISKANIWLKMTSTTLDGMAATMKEVKSLIGTIPIDNNDPTTRNNIAYQLTLMREQLADMGNTQLENQYIFSGTDTTTQPYNRAVQDPPVAGDYQGNSAVTKVQIDFNATETMNIPGSDVLGGGTPPPARVDILKELDTLIATLKAGPISASDRTTYANLMEQGAQQIQTAQVTAATRVKRLDLMSKMLDNTKNTLETVFSNVQNADYAKLGVELSQQKAAFEATLSSTAKISQMSLLDYL
ncbi:flagellar hook-associated protein FlgL [Trichlorobacter ammonificans]|uniref:Flagellar hook-associated protein flgL n=1 Tax=Trichlorobacter ammonificans TaxID=2916410 RepID=A0ABN8HEP6_9BACT|nr:flagellar hook-associated protein FlgL [Trichlorobacter ammonificans]CAH2030016.1 Flagellar hook-associated protein flgL [Trichlorobacter ammonificans]